MVERQLPKLYVVSSILIARSSFLKADSLLSPYRDRDGSRYVWCLRLFRASHGSDGEPATSGTALLCPYLGRELGHLLLKGGARSAVDERGDIFASESDEYEAFIAKVIDTARHLEPRPHNDPQLLKGLG